MRVLRHYTGLDAPDRGCVVAIGNFDGVHNGHRAVIGAAMSRAAELGAPAAALTFEPHPRAVFQSDIVPFRLTPFRSKARRIETLGIDLLFVLHFDIEFSRRSAETFVDEILVDGLGASQVVVGEDFVFGHGRRGTAKFLTEAAESHGFEVTVVPAASGPDGTVYSSTRIRQLLRDGKPRDAAALLGRPWEIEGRVETGNRRGHTIGFPTANIDLDEYLRPATGVYAVRAGLDRAGDTGTETVWYDGVANLGHRPTFGGEGLVLEVNIFDFSGDIYGKHLRVALVEHLRPEKKFDGIEALRAQISEDAARARATAAAAAK